MSEYKLWELAKSREEIHILAQQVVEDWEGVNKTRKGNWDEEAVALAYVVHQEFWHRARPITARPPYTHRIVGLYMSEALRIAVPDLDGAFTESVRNQIIRSIYAALASAQLMIRIGNSGAGATFLIRNWPSGFNLEWAAADRRNYIPLKDRPDLERQDRKAVKEAGPVIVHTDFRAIPAPKPNLDSVMNYIQKIMPVMIQLQTENDELRKKLNELDSSRWQEITDVIDQARR